MGVYISLTLLFLYIIASTLAWIDHAPYLLADYDYSKGTISDVTIYVSDIINGLETPVPRRINVFFSFVPANPSYVLSSYLLLTLPPEFVPIDNDDNGCQMNGNRIAMTIIDDHRASCLIETAPLLTPQFLSRINNSLSFSGQFISAVLTFDILNGAEKSSVTINAHLPYLVDHFTTIFATADQNQSRTTFDTSSMRVFLVARFYQPIKSFGLYRPMFRIDAPLLFFRCDITYNDLNGNITVYNTQHYDIWYRPRRDKPSLQTTLFPLPRTNPGYVLFDCLARSFNNDLTSPTGVDAFSTIVLLDPLSNLKPEDIDMTTTDKILIQQSSKSSFRIPFVTSVSPLAVELSFALGCSHFLSCHIAIRFIGQTAGFLLRSSISEYEDNEPDPPNLDPMNYYAPFEGFIVLNTYSLGLPSPTSCYQFIPDTIDDPQKISMTRVVPTHKSNFSVEPPLDNTIQFTPTYSIDRTPAGVTSVSRVTAPLSVDDPFVLSMNHLYSLKLPIYCSFDGLRGLHQLPIFDYGPSSSPQLSRPLPAFRPILHSLPNSNIHLFSPKKVKAASALLTPMSPPPFIPRANLPRINIQISHVPNASPATNFSTIRTSLTRFILTTLSAVLEIPTKYLRVIEILVTTNSNIDFITIGIQLMEGPIYKPTFPECLRGQFVLDPSNPYQYIYNSKVYHQKRKTNEYYNSNDIFESRWKELVAGNNVCDPYLNPNCPLRSSSNDSNDSNDDTGENHKDESGIPFVSLSELHHRDINSTAAASTPLHNNTCSKPRGYLSNLDRSSNLVDISCHPRPPTRDTPSLFSIASENARLLGQQDILDTYITTTTKDKVNNDFNALRYNHDNNDTLLDTYTALLKNETDAKLYAVRQRMLYQKEIEISQLRSQIKSKQADTSSSSSSSNNATRPITTLSHRIIDDGSDLPQLRFESLTVDGDDHHDGVHRFSLQDAYKTKRIAQSWLRQQNNPTISSQRIAGIRPNPSHHSSLQRDPNASLDFIRPRPPPSPIPSYSNDLLSALRSTSATLHSQRARIRSSNIVIDPQDINDPFVFPEELQNYCDRTRSNSTTSIRTSASSSSTTEPLLLREDTISQGAPLWRHNATTMLRLLNEKKADIAREIVLFLSTEVHWQQIWPRRCCDDRPSRLFPGSDAVEDSIPFTFESSQQSSDNVLNALNIDDNSPLSHPIHQQKGGQFSPSPADILYMKELASLNSLLFQAQMGNIYSSFGLKRPPLRSSPLNFDESEDSDQATTTPIVPVGDITVTIWSDLISGSTSLFSWNSITDGYETSMDCGGPYNALCFDTLVKQPIDDTMTTATTSQTPPILTRDNKDDDGNVYELYPDVSIADAFPPTQTTYTTIEQLNSISNTQHNKCMYNSDCISGYCQPFALYGTSPASLLAQLARQDKPSPGVCLDESALNVLRVAIEAQHASFKGEFDNVEPFSSVYELTGLVQIASLIHQTVLDAVTWSVTPR